MCDAGGNICRCQMCGGGIVRRVKVHIEEHFISSFWVPCEDMDIIDDIVNRKYKNGELKVDRDRPSNVLYAVEEHGGEECDFTDMDIDSYLV